MALTLDQLSNLVETLQKRVDTLETEVKQYRQDILELEQQLSQSITTQKIVVRSDAQIAGRNVLADGQMLDEHKGKLTSHDGTLNAHEGKLGSHDGTLDEHKGKLTSHDGTLNAHEGRLNSHDGTLSGNGDVSVGGANRLGFALYDSFSFDGKTMGHYSLGWFPDSWQPDGNTAWFSGWGGIKIFTGGGTKLSIDQAGNILYAVSMNKSSSRELKENIATFPTKDAVEILEGLDPVSYNLKTDREKRLHIGFIAEDVPEVVSSHAGKAISNDNITAVLTKVVKEQQKTISALQEEIELLKNQI